MEKLLGWHFCNESRTLGYDDGRLIVEGEALRVETNPVILCECGLHASERIIDALKYAPGPILCRVELSDGIVVGADKAAARERKTLWMFDATNALRDFATTVAESALLAERAAGREPDPRSWAAIQFVRDLLTGKIKSEDQESAESAALSAAWSAESAALSAARSAALSTARSAALSAAWSAALSAAWSAESAAWSVWSAARSAALSAARSAESAAWSVWSAARSAARSAESAALSAARSAESAALSAARSAESAALSAQNNLLLQIIEKWRANDGR